MAKGNIRKTWLIIKNIINGPEPSEKNPIHEIKIDNNKVIDPVSIANEFNKFFVNIGSNLANQISHENGDISDYLKSSFQKSMDAFILTKLKYKI